MKNKLVLAVGGMGIAAALLITGTAFAQTPGAGGHQGYGSYQGRGMPGRGGVGGTSAMRPAVFGTVSAINGSSLTVASKGFGKNASTTTTATVYTVDATNATVFKNNATSSLGTVAVGDTVVVQGTVSGTLVTATTIRDGMPAMGMRAGQPGPGGMGSSTQMHSGWPPNASTTPNAKGSSGFMGAIGGFFKHLLGFF